MVNEFYSNSSGIVLVEVLITAPEENVELAGFPSLAAEVSQSQSRIAYALHFRTES